MKRKSYRWILTVLCLLAVTGLRAQEAAEEIPELQKEMYRLFTQTDTTRFFEVTNRLKDLCLEADDEQGFYKAWGNQAIYESTKLRRTHAMEIAKEMKAYAQQEDSKFGKYTATHVIASIYYQMQNYHEAEQNFLEAIDDLHRDFPGQSAAADYLELQKIYTKFNSLDTAYVYAEKVLHEPNVAPVHELRALSMLCQLIGVRDNPDREQFNKYYYRRAEVREETAADHLEPLIEVLYYIVNGNYARAMELAEKMPVEDSRYSLMATIFHRTGDDPQAYRYMVMQKNVSDSLHNSNQRGLLTDYMEQLSSERLEVERQQLERENLLWRDRFLYTIVSIIIVLLAYVLYRRFKTIGRLERHNTQLTEENRAARKATEEARRELDVKHEFLNNLSHKLKEPLNPIMGFSDILATPGFEVGPEERQAMSEHIKSNLKLLTNLIDEMFDMTFYEGLKEIPKADVVAPNVICMHVTDEYKQKAPKGVVVSFETELPNEQTICTDLQSVEKVLRQLFDNAVKFTESGVIQLHCSEHGDSIRFAVSDTGPGIDDKHRKHLFEPMGQPDTDINATGMGLAICSTVARLLGGTISLDESYTDGSRFVFDVPKE